MSTDLNIDTLLKQDNSFVRASTVEFDSSITKRITSCLELEGKGVPFVVRGAPLDTDPDTPFNDSTEWLKRLSSIGQFSLGFEWRRYQDIISGSARRLDNMDHAGLEDGKRGRRCVFCINSPNSRLTDICQHMFYRALSNGRGGWELRPQFQAVCALTKLLMSFLNLSTRPLVL